jgi:hypothetical protein
MEAPTLIRNRVPRYGDTYVLDLPTKGALAEVPGRVGAAPQVFVGCWDVETHPPEQNGEQKRALVEILTGLRGAQLDDYRVVLMDRGAETDSEVTGWWPDEGGSGSTSESRRC